MSAPQSFVQAALQRLGVRLGSGLVDVAANLALLAQDAPERLRQELQLFWEEVKLEAARIERGEAGEPEAVHSPGPSSSAAPDPQEQIDSLRAQVAALARRLDQPS